jgi:hypothetical protein
MKRITPSPIWTAALLLALAACGGGDKVQVKESDPDQPVRPPADAPSTAPTPTEELDSILRT